MSGRTTAWHSRSPIAAAALTECLGDSQSRSVTSLSGSFSSESAFSGTLRMTVDRGGKTCDSGPLPVVASPG